MMFELLLDVMDRLLNLRDTNAECENINFFGFRIRNFVTPIIESVRTPARITPYPTGRLFWGGTVPGTSCQATIAPSLRDISQQALARYAEHNANFVLIVSGSLETQRTKKFIEIVYDLLIKAIELSSFALLKFGVRAVGLK